MAISSHQVVRGTRENTHGCQFEGFFFQDASLLHSSQSQDAPSLLSQNKRMTAKGVKDLKN